MQIVCFNCGYVINRDVYMDGILIEEYKNIYGTTCPHCGHVIKPDKHVAFVEEMENKKRKFSSIIIGKLRKKILGE